jgi:hypothetical protein
MRLDIKAHTYIHTYIHTTPLPSFFKSVTESVILERERVNETQFVANAKKKFSSLFLFCFPTILILCVI